MQKKCAHCGEIMEIDIDNICDIAQFKANYYHSACLLELAAKRKKNKRHAEYWDTMESDIAKYEKAAKDTILFVTGRDKLNEHILTHYDVVTPPKRLWEALSDLDEGKYRQKKCRPVSSMQIYETWAWGQHKLDETARYNKANNKGPKDDEARILYDFAIVVGKVPVYLKFREKQRVEDAERALKAKEAIKIDYNNISIKTNEKSDGLDDISDLLDDLF